MIQGTGEIVYPKGYCCQAARMIAAAEGGTQGTTARCGNRAVEGGGLCIAHQNSEDVEFTSTPDMILVKFNLSMKPSKPGKVSAFDELRAAGVRVVDRPLERHEHYNSKREAEEKLREGVAFMNRVQKDDRPLLAATGVQVFGEQEDEFLRRVSAAGIIPELEEAGYVVIDYHILKLPAYSKTPPKLVIEMVFGGKPFDKTNWGLIEPIVNRRFVKDTVVWTAHVWVNPVPLGGGKSCITHTVNFKERNDALPQWLLHFNEAKWAAEVVAETVVKPNSNSVQV